MTLQQVGAWGWLHAHQRSASQLDTLAAAQKLDEWRAASEVFSRGASALRGVSFHKKMNVWRAQGPDPVTGKKIELLKVKPDVPDAQQQCGRAYDRAQILWHGRCAAPRRAAIPGALAAPQRPPHPLFPCPMCSAAKTNYGIESYVNDGDAAVARIARDHAAGERVAGTAGEAVSLVSRLLLC